MQSEYFDTTKAAAKRNAEILKCKHEIQLQHKKLRLLQTEHRREKLLGSLELAPHNTWCAMLTEKERHDKELVLKAIACGAFVPSKTSQDYNESLLSEEMLEDRDIFLAYQKNKGRWVEVPQSLCDDKEVMIAVCACKVDDSLERASESLRDDGDVVSVAVGAVQKNFRFASDRLRSDKYFIMDLIKRVKPNHCLGYFYCPHDFAFLEYKKLCIEDEKEIASAVLHKCLESGKRCHLALHHLPCFSLALRDDEETMMKFVQNYWGNIKDCSERLRSCKAIVDTAMSKDENAIKHALGSYREELIAGLKNMDKADVLQALENDKMCFDHISDDLKSDIDVLEAAIKCRAVDFRDLSVDQQTERRLIFAGATYVDFQFLEIIPDCWKGNEELAAVILEGRLDFHCALAVFEMFPSLYRSKDAILNALDAQSFSDYHELIDILEKTAFLDDDEVMIAACVNYAGCGERLLSNRKFVSNVLTESESAHILDSVSEKFMKDNVDLIIQGIEYSPDGYGFDYNFFDCVLDQRDVIMACLPKCQPDFLPTLQTKANCICFLDDEEIMHRAIENEPADLAYASSRLRGDRKFILSVAGICGRNIIYANRSLQRDDDILVKIYYISQPKHIPTIVYHLK